jgi:hypothetical protein
VKKVQGSSVPCTFFTSLAPMSVLSPRSDARHEKARTTRRAGTSCEILQETQRHAAYLVAMTAISTSTSRGKRDASMVARAGGADLKYSA